MRIELKRIHPKVLLDAFTELERRLNYRCDSTWYGCPWGCVHTCFDIDEFGQYEARNIDQHDYIQEWCRNCDRVFLSKLGITREESGCCPCSEYEENHLVEKLFLELKNYIEELKIKVSELYE